MSLPYDLTNTNISNTYPRLVQYGTATGAFYDGLGVTLSIGGSGPQGFQGDIGPTGPQGFQGDIGPTGPQGFQGDIGLTGHTGNDGPQGDQGNDGPQGDQGPTGPQGDQGPTGPQGDQGPTGPPSAHTHSDTEVNLTKTYTGNLAGATTQKDANDILDALVGGGVFIRRSAFVPPFTSYRGFAPENSLETDAVWTITKTVENANGTIFSNEQVFNHKWTEINTI